MAAEARAAGGEVELTGFVLLAEGGGGDRCVLVEVRARWARRARSCWRSSSGRCSRSCRWSSPRSRSSAPTSPCSGLTAVTDVIFVVQYLVALIGLGVAIDYSLLVVTRWREERADGRRTTTPVRPRCGTAGRSVLFSGVTVAVSLAALVLVPLPFLRSIGLGGLLIPLFSVATTLTLVPALLSAVGPRLLWPRRSSRPSPAARSGSGSPATVLAHRWLHRHRLDRPCLLALAAPGARPHPRLAAALGPGVGRRAAVPGSHRGRRRRRTRRRAAPDRGAGARPRRRGPSPSGCREWTAWRRCRAVPTDAWQDGGDELRAGVVGRRPGQRRRRRRPSNGCARRRPGRWRSVGGSPAQDADFVARSTATSSGSCSRSCCVTFLLLARALRSLWLPGEGAGRSTWCRSPRRTA